MKFSGREWLCNVPIFPGSGRGSAETSFHCISCAREAKTPAEFPDELHSF